MKPISSILLLIACLVFVPSQAQTPYDTFAPETARPMLGLEAFSSVSSERTTAVESMSDSAVYAIVIDPKQQSVYLLNLVEHTLLAAAPLTDDVLKWLSVDPLSDKYPNISPYAYCNWNPIKYVDPNGKSTHTNEDGYVVAVYDDNDLNIYKHSTAQLESWKASGNQRLTNEGAITMGQSLHAWSFADQNRYNQNPNDVVPQVGMKIDFGSTVLGDLVSSAIKSRPSLLTYMLKARSGGAWDFKSKLPNHGSLLYGNTYASSRDAGNFLAGAIKKQSGLLSPIVQFGYGAYNLSGNNFYKTALITSGVIGLMQINPLEGVAVASYVMNGEDRLSQLCIDKGYNYVK